MASFYVSHFKPHGRARLHRNDCPDCRDGQGQAGQHKMGVATRWFGPFATKSLALAKMASLNPKHPGECGRCKP